MTLGGAGDDALRNPWRRAFEPSSELLFDMPIDDRVVEWWAARFSETQMTPIDLGRRLVAGIEGRPVIRYTTIDPSRDEVRVQANLFRDLCTEVCFTGSSFQFDQRLLNLDLAEVAVDHQGRRIGRTIGRNCLDLAIGLGMRRMGVTAISAGAYVWARMGFVPTYESWNDGRSKNAISQAIANVPDIDHRLRNLVWTSLGSADPKAIWTIADITARIRIADPPGTLKLGAYLLSRVGASWSGYFDLADPTTLARAESYLRG